MYEKHESFIKEIDKKIHAAFTNMECCSKDLICIKEAKKMVMEMVGYEISVEYEQVSKEAHDYLRERLENIMESCAEKSFGTFQFIYKEVK